VLRDLRASLRQHDWLAATDAKGAFPQLPLRVEDIPLFLYLYYDVVNDPELAGTDQDALYAHMHGFFGPRNLPHAWMQVAWLLIAIASHRGVKGVHAYMDDFPMAAPTHQQALDKLQQFCTIMHEAGITENKAKRELPFQRGAVLGVGFDTVSAIHSTHATGKSATSYRAIDEDGRFTMRDFETLAITEWAAATHMLGAAKAGGCFAAATIECCTRLEQAVSQEEGEQQVGTCMR
jgi:hypothetical protein